MEQMKQFVLAERRKRDIHHQPDDPVQLANIRAYEEARHRRHMGLDEPKSKSPPKKKVALTAQEKSRLAQLEKHLTQMNQAQRMGMMMDEDQRDMIEAEIRKLKGSGASVGAGLQQKEELMAERNGQYVGLSKGRPGVRPKGGRKLVPIDQLPSVVGGGFLDDVGQAFRYTPFGMASDAIQGRPTVFHGD